MRSPNHVQRYILTGAPGAGKTTVLQALATRGMHCVEESARRIIRSRLDSGLSPRQEPREFARAILRSDVDSYVAAPTGPGPVFFDRGIPDALGMMNQLGDLPPEEQNRYVRDYPYSPTVFLFPPWEEIFRADSERDQTFDDALRVDEVVREWYARLGFTLVEVARTPVDDRCEFLLAAYR